ncbi:Helix-turn-helix domain-containing protein [Prosthecobacter debontii]|uniref:Helix-turn-helix domain-containing protein n=1 Tax=Prosthecobacter debontii TaxID=48467 RepID=A0A1T4YWP3_9BACT|nr:AraC family transcriptional regulator [Prosthecobacter debontii]SKB06200.1 Helix-turn-helix domain-containing protein [Prosthecobacter debontii]
MLQETSVLSLVPAGAAHRVVGNRAVALPGVTVDILTTRKIELEQWELRRFHDPYWRLYWPLGAGGIIEINGEETALQPGHVYLIPPHTTFSTRTRQPFAKWYAHFNLGPLADRAAPGIYQYPITAEMRSLMQKVTLPSSEKIRFPWHSILWVTEAVQCLPDSVWEQQRLDPRVLTAMEFMNTHLSLKLTAEQIAKYAGLSVRNLNHLFQQELQQAPMRVLLDYRLDEACRLLRHGDASIDEIAEQCGLINRHYLSRMMRQYRNTSPAAYRNEMV